MREPDGDEFTAFVGSQHGHLFRTAYLLTGDYHLAEDVLQATLVKAYLHWPRVRAMAQPTAYVRRILVNQTVSWRRKRSSRETPVLALEDAGANGHAESVADHQTVWQAILQLPPRQRAVIVLRYYEDLPDAEIAATLHMAVGTVKSHCHQACQRLSGLLAESESAHTAAPRHGDQS
jgi:RNA polymerase sigma-70 factor (sigma-E family)